ncbi:hypothetical protein [Streptacidiphilus fuscans]|uniref:Uncharacterized protein n=1 Tax=Streptacidiphilus fuscans TaxID=2789292 RepID=A0A931B9W1_9ACTN|nr:hypothetical protein [Streptacidiphilus fuscans]MBF9072838.1 hypothetical protein [Streptacidiphilus fuscans]
MSKHDQETVQAPRAKAAVTFAAVVLLLLAGAAATLAFSVPQMVAAARWTGTPGQIAIHTCNQIPRHEVVCDGTFQSDDGRTVDPDASITAPLSPGDVLPVQRTTSGTYDRVGVSAFCGFLAVSLFGCSLAATGVMLPLALTRRFRLRAVWLAVALMACTALASAFVGGIAAIASS